MGFRMHFAAGLVGAVGLAGVALAQTAAPAVHPSSPAVQDATAAADHADRTLFETNCSGCHTLDQVVSQHHDAAEWQATVQQMIGYGAAVSPEDADRIARYLAVHYGKEGTPAAAPVS